MRWVWGENKQRRRENLRVDRRSDEVGLWRLRGFSLEDDEVDDMMSKVQKYDSLIMDLRGNHGGWEDTLVRLAGHFFSSETKIADARERKKLRTIKAKPPSKTYKGKLVVLVDSQTASAAEIFSRLVQLTGRGRVFGDQTAGCNEGSAVSA